MEYEEQGQKASALELLHQALVQGNQDAWAELQQCLGETMRNWVRTHPSKEAAWSFESEEHYVALAFEQFRQAAIEGQAAFNTLAEALVYLRASLHGAILETLRASSRPGAFSLTEPEAKGAPNVEDHPTSLEVWGWLQARLSSERERRLAYLLYHCGLSPREIVRCCPQEWSDVQEVARLRRTILERLLHNANQFTLTAQIGRGDSMRG
jgi:hypothetical protein